MKIQLVNDTISVNIYVLWYKPNHKKVSQMHRNSEIAPTARKEYFTQEFYNGTDLQKIIYILNFAE